MSNLSAKRKIQSSTTTPPQLPQQLEKSIPHVAMTFAPNVAEQSTRPSLPLMSSGKVQRRVPYGTTASAQLPHQPENSSLPQPSMRTSSPVMSEPIRRLSISPASSPSIPSLGTEASQNPTQGSPASSNPWGIDPSDNRMWKQFKWLPQHEVAIRRNWNLKCIEILRHTMHNVQKDMFLKQMRPNWIPPNVMDDLEEIWTLENYKSKCNTAKVNRASSTGGTQHKGGSIPNTEHRRRLALQLGRNPTQYELFTNTHFDVKTNQFVDIRSAEISEHYMRVKASRSSSVGSPSVEESNQLDGEEMRIWLQVAGGKNKKG
ncbi:uncharacterized protein LOC114718904 [Neltuma alba]|uniref:uncharacterized protein LOC114718904 n=1 Tax=Neltuma alba TaxID=207710 RepID=UPI0010A2E118|nr:uncharacterized protein LOC114718904 [Prosopis alba]